ncbi:GTP 3',8-cyclase MoaA [Alginatibacterium sediminis]|uniref:GTP 3',8-cyclase n=1 Tax=Alginatibacterium sediminis TaxID=2164068 RepID=A0A420EHT4_9ALTE|nr:GTP 3',8-cyclase MoaA [Alginatibacterium sediminis]RKF20214.1 GTP 3',8-cyclase MoaA [Alginatibacterium sediminis]
MLEDAYARKFYYLRLSITDVCNFSCNYCLPDGYHAQHDESFLNLSEIKTVTSAFARLGTNKIRITGGEPSLRKDLPDIIAHCAQTPGIKKVAMTTNGFRMEKDIERWLDAGLNAINVSVDSLFSEQFNQITGTQSFKKVMAGIDKAVDLGFTNLKLNSVLMRQGQQANLKRFLEWIKDRPVEVRFIELMEMAENKDYFDKHHSSGSSLKDQLLAMGWQQQIVSKNAGPAQVFGHRDYKGKIGLIMPYSKDFCASCNRLRISARGHLHLCLFSDAGIDLRQYLQLDDGGLALSEQLIMHIQGKKVSHFLHQHDSGATQNLASIGG